MLLAAVFAAAVLAGPVNVCAETQARPAPKPDPSFLHGLGKTIGGVVFEFPKTVLDATFSGPPVVGTLIGVLAGAARALQVTTAGIIEMGEGFNPWGASPRHR